MSSAAVQITDLGKRYRLGGASQADTLREALTRAVTWPVRAAGRLVGRTTAHSRKRTLWALKGVSFEVAEGEVVGVIGPNGAGKTTLLKILSRITWPTEGSAAIRGRVGSLLEVGTGFHPELTGRENLFLNAAILGMSRGEIRANLDSIVDFAGVESFLDTPIKHYSSGMSLRLAFSVAAHLQPEILIIDEVLAVGDAAFQKKCLGKMGEVAREGRTILFVSHNMAAVSSLCSRVVYLREGSIVDDGDPDSIISRYLDDIDASSKLPLDQRSHEGSGEARFTHVRMLGDSGSARETFLSGERVIVELTCEATKPLAGASFHVGVYGYADQLLALLDSGVYERRFDLEPGTNRVRCELPRVPLSPGSYSLSLAVVQGKQLVDAVAKAKVFRVEGGDYFGSGKLPVGGSLLIDHDWSERIDKD